MCGNGGLLDPEDEALEVLTLGMVDVDGMVGRLCELMQDAHLAAALCCCAEHSEPELLLAHGLRAGEGEEHSPTLNLAESLGVETPIAHECVLEGALVLGKCWRVEDDEVVGVGLDMVEEIEGILSKGLVPAVARVIKLHVAASEAHSLAGAVDAVDELCPATHGIEGESTSVAEHVEHTSVVAVALEQGAVLALIDEEASLLASEPVDMELESVLDCDIGVELTNEILILGVEMSFIGQCGLALVVNIADNPRRQIDQCLRDALAREVHAWRVGLDDGCAAIDVDDQSGQEVALTMDEAEGVVVGAHQPEGLPHTPCLSEAVAIEVVVDSGVAPRKDAYHNAAHLEVSVADVGAIAGEHRDDVAFLDSGVGMSDCPREHPGVKSLE